MIVHNVSTLLVFWRIEAWTNHHHAADGIFALILLTCWNIVNWTLRNKFQWNSIQNSNIFIEENTFCNVICKMLSILCRPQCVNSLWPSDAIWRQRSWSSLVQVMTCCLTAPSHYLNQYWRYITETLWQSSESNFTASTQAAILRNEFENFGSKIIVRTSRGQWVEWKFFLFCFKSFSEA